MVAVILLLLGFVLVIVETHVAAGGLFGLLAIVFILSGGKIVVDEGQILGWSVDWGLFLGIALGISIFLFIVGKLTHRALKTKDISGTESMIGQQATINEWYGRQGLVTINGELWKAVTDYSENFQVNDIVIIKECDDLKLKLTPSKKS